MGTAAGILSSEAGADLSVSPSTKSGVVEVTSSSIDLGVAAPPDRFRSDDNEFIDS